MTDATISSSRFGKMMRAIKNQGDPSTLWWSIFALLLLVAMLIVGIITQPDKGPPILILVVCLTWGPLGLSWSIKHMMKRQEEDDYLTALAEKKRAYRAELDRNFPELSNDEKAKRVKLMFMLDEPFYF